MSMYKHIRELWKRPKENLGDLWKQRLIQWRREPATLRIERPTRLDRARSIGYKPKQGFVVARQRVDRGGRQRPTIRKGRRSKHFGQRKDLDMSYQQVAEQRASKKYVNCEVLNSYYVGEDGQYKYYETVLVDSNHPSIKKDKDMKWITKQRKRVFRGLTSAGKKSRDKRKKS